MHQWQICADGNQFRGICSRCDYLLNALVLKLLRVPRAASKLMAYRRKLGLRDRKGRR